MRLGCEYCLLAGWECVVQIVPGRVLFIIFSDFPLVRSFMIKIDRSFVIALILVWLTLLNSVEFFLKLIYHQWHSCRQFGLSRFIIRRVFKDYLEGATIKWRIISRGADCWRQSRLHYHTWVLGLFIFISRGYRLNKKLL